MRPLLALLLGTGLASFAALAVSPARADAPYVVERVETSGDVVRAYVVASVAPVLAAVREHATEAARRAAPAVFANRDLGTHRLRDLRLDVRNVAFTPGANPSEVRIDVDADVTAQRHARRVVFEGFVPTIAWVPEGRRRIAGGTLVVRVAVAIVGGEHVVVRILGERLELERPLAVDLALNGRVLHTHAQPIVDHPSIAGLRPEAAALRSVDARELRFVVRFRRR